jgi:Bacterial regulatory protein, Fis family
MKQHSVVRIYLPNPDSNDLFGDPIPTDRGRVGRPRHLVSSRNTRKFIALRDAGWTQAQMAEALGISPPTLRRHYFAGVKRAQGGGARPGAGRPPGARSRSRNAHLIAALDKLLLQPAELLALRRRRGGEP